MNQQQNSQPLNYERLKLHTEAQINLSNKKIEELENLINKYKYIQDQIEILPNKTTHKTHVKFGSLAFFEGKIIHTNEFLVLLGDNYFVERSHTQTIEILQRQIQKMMEKKNNFEALIQDLQKKLSFINEMIQLKNDYGNFEILEFEENENENENNQNENENENENRK
ncbi:RNA polymerase ii subunit 5-mediating protein nnx3 [Anaeramoeba ignava]|uniref:RNA polymerase ii subunit 5-mediating protein nnx3 n=1 Tax=Anaeramoeba ignava TaxID=1746090 RepID=A0A9Q0LHG7_ANAIG|nr:RNA polymerase ii subunit 5-mediating protein nnx3 [Anaeramoeba ignava]